MGKMHEAILPEHEKFIRKQKIFFVGTAPLQEDGHINLSPKGHDAFRIISPTEVAYLDLTGSGNETSAHIAENGRITFMFVAVEGPPNIMRLYGYGETILPGTPKWEELIGRFELMPGYRQIIYVKLHAVKSSCGYSIPFFHYEGERETLVKWADQKGEQGIKAYQKEKNSTSMDNLPTPIGLAQD